MRLTLALVALLCVIHGDAGASPIKHVVTLMMENRAFDHILGFLKEKNPEINGLTGKETQPVDSSKPNGEHMTVNQNGYDKGPDDPRHGFDDTTDQIFGYQKPMGVVAVPKMDGFVSNARRHNASRLNPISMFAPTNAGGRSAAPVLNGLADEFAVFDEWFCSLPGPTDPNRAFAMSGTANGVVTNYNGTLWTQESYFNYLTRHNVSWKAHYMGDLWAIMYFTDMRKAENHKNVQPMETFFEEAKSGKLSQFTWLQPRMTAHTGIPNWQHPDASVAEGERLINQVYEALRNGPLWNSTMFFITYDEHGGFYDHVPPPQEGVPAPDRVFPSNGFTYNRLGVRIPAVAVSPWIKKHTVVHRPPPAQRPQATSQYEATSLIHTCNKMWGLPGTLGARMAWSGTFEHIFTGVHETAEDGTLSLEATPRTDCPLSFDAWGTLTAEQHAAELAEQRAKPVNDHLEIQIDYYCEHASPRLLHSARGLRTSAAEMDEIEKAHKQACHAARENQGTASDFIESHVPKFWEIIRAQNSHTEPVAQLL